MLDVIWQPINHTSGIIDSKSARNLLRGRCFCGPWYKKDAGRAIRTRGILCSSEWQKCCQGAEFSWTEPQSCQHISESFFWSQVLFWTWLGKVRLYSGHHHSSWTSQTSHLRALPSASCLSCQWAQPFPWSWPVRADNSPQSGRGCLSQHTRNGHFKG